MRRLRIIDNYCTKIRRKIKGERIKWYGGMSQEIMERFERNGDVEFVFMEEAEAESVRRTKSKNRRRNQALRGRFVLF